MDHGHNQIGGIGAQQFLERFDTIGHFHRKTYALAGLCQLTFQLRAVGNEDHLPMRKLRMTIHLPNHEHHRQRFARSLRVPDNTAALARALALKQSFHRQFNGAELLITANDLDRLPLVVG